MRSKTFFKYSWLPTILVMLTLAGLQVCVSLRESSKDRSIESHQTDDLNRAQELNLGGGKASSEKQGAQHPVPPIDGQPIAEDRGLGSPPVIEEDTLEAPVTKALLDSGFTPNEAEVIYKSVEKSVQEANIEDGEDSINLGIRAALKALGLPMEKEKSAREAYSIAVDESGGSINFREWKECLAVRLASVPASACLSDIVADYEKEIAEATPSDTITLSLIDHLEPIMLRAIEKAEKACKLPPAEGLKLLYINLFGC